MPVLTRAGQMMRGEEPRNSIYDGKDQVWPSQPRFDPNSLTGLKIWLDAVDYSGSSWTNKGSGGPTVNVVGTPSPTISPNTLNDLPLVRFKPNEGRMRANGTTGVHKNWTLVYVGRMIGPSAGRVVDSIYPEGGNLLVGFWNGYMDVAYDNGFASPNTQVPVLMTTWKLYTGDCDGTTTRLLSNGVELGSMPGNSGWGNCFAISGYSLSGVEETCDAEVAEVLQYDHKLSDGELQQIEAYLRTKWGLS